MPYTLNRIGIPLTGYQKYLMNMRQEIKGVSAFSYYGVDNCFHIIDGNVEIENIFNEYNIIQYNMLFDNAKSMELFFDYTYLNDGGTSNE